MFERFTDRARRVVVLAQEEARLLNHNYIGTEHILLGLIHEGEGVAAKALEGPFLQYSQQFCLGHERKLAHFVQKQRAAVGKLKAPFACGVCAGEGPALMAEQFAFNEVFWQGGAVERNKGLVGARAARMDGARSQFFARAGFAL